MMKNYDESVEINHNPNWSSVPDHPYRNLIIAGSGSGKTNALLSLINYQRPDFDNIYLFLIYLCQRSNRIKVSIAY